MSSHKLSTVNVNQGTHKLLKSLSKTHDKPIVELIQFMALYMKQSGLNPDQVTSESPQKAIKELSKRVDQVIGVVKVLEQEKLNPLLEQIMMLVRRSEMVLKDAPTESSFKTVIARLETMIEEDQKYHTEQLKAQHDFYMKEIEALLKKYKVGT